MILTAAIIVFLVLESLNIMLLYFRPESRLGNAVGVFTAFERSKADLEVHALVRYLVNWVAGTKLIFVALLVVIIAFGTEETKGAAAVALVLSILTFYWRLYPALLRMDRSGELLPRGYSKTLGIMVGSFVIGFVVALLLFLRQR